MTTLFRAFLILFICVGIASSNAVAQTGSSSAKKLAQPSTEDLMKQFASAWNGGDAQAAGSLIADNGVLIGGAVQIQGKQNLQSQWLTENVSGTRNLVVTSFNQGGNESMAYQTGRWSLEAKDSGQKISGNYTFVWQKTADKSWKIQMIHVENDKQN